VQNCAVNKHVINGISGQCDGRCSSTVYQVSSVNCYSKGKERKSIYIAPFTMQA